MNDLPGSLILQTALRFLVPVLLVFALFLTLRGHHVPGGGFIGGLALAGALTLYALAYGTAAVRRALPLAPRSAIALGLTFALAAAVAPLAAGRPLLTGLWTTLHLPGEVTAHLGTPLVFDLGVFFVVAGITLTILFALEDRGAALFQHDAS